MRVIDAHHHFWKYTPEEYGWIDDSMGALRRDFLPVDLRATLDGAAIQAKSASRFAAGVDAAVSVQARQSLEETAWLLGMAEQHDFLAGVVGWVPLIDPGVEQILEHYASRPKLKAIRHIVQGEPDDRFLLRDNFNRGIRALTAVGLVYDILIYERHLPVAIEFVDRHPRQRFVLDHIAKPRIRDAAIEPWRANLRELARRENVFCKLSGVATEADFPNLTPDHRGVLRPYMDAALEAFGPRRIMFGSDWPVCLAAMPYGDWFGMVRDAIGGFSESEQEWVLGGTAAQAYGL
jgi:L-fuconolactonase